MTTAIIKPILPKHLFIDIPVSHWPFWNPDPSSATMVTSGPFNVSDHVTGVYTELTRNPTYFRGRDDNTTSLTQSFNLFDVLGSSGILVWVITVPSLVIFAFVLLKRRRARMS